MRFNIWHHSPAHLFVPDTDYFLTASTLYKAHCFKSNERLQYLQDTLVEVFGSYDWKLQGWAIFSNHYHLIARSPEKAETLRSIVNRVHSETAREINRLDHVSGRRVWYQYRDTCLSYEKSFLARLNYVIRNPVKHGLVNEAENYPFCSARWFRDKAPPAFRRKVESFRFDRLKIDDEFEPVWEP